MGLFQTSDLPDFGQSSRSAHEFFPLSSQRSALDRLWSNAGVRFAPREWENRRYFQRKALRPKKV